MLSPQAPSAGSYRPSGTGCSKLSNVTPFWILLTERALISALERKAKSTLSIAEEMGCEMFILTQCHRSAGEFAENRLRRNT